MPEVVPGTEPLPISVVVPVRNAEAFLEECLASVARQGPTEIIVVDGQSTDGTLEIAGRYTIASFRTAVGALRLLAGWASLRPVRAGSPSWMPTSSFLTRRCATSSTSSRRASYVGLQAGLHSVSGDGYWGRALVEHHRTGRSKNWFGLVATLFERDAFLSIGLDEAFLSGEDIELRVRLERAGARVAVSTRTEVTHRFGDGSHSRRANGLPMDRALPEPSASTAGGRPGFFASARCVDSRDRSDPRTAPAGVDPVLPVLLCLQLCRSRPGGEATPATQKRADTCAALTSRRS